MLTIEEIRQDATLRISAALRNGLIPWRNPILSDHQCAFPIHAATRQPLTGMARLLLQTAAHENHFVSCWWATRDEWRNLGSLMIRGNIPTSLSVLLDDGRYDEVEFLNAEQVTGPAHHPYLTSPYPLVEVDFSKVQRLIRATGAEIRIGVGDHNHDASWTGYIPPSPWDNFPQHERGDYILIPHLADYQSEISWYFSIMHELMHWAEVRTGWRQIDIGTRELVAEIGSGWLATELGVPPCPDVWNHKKWLPAWLEGMSDPMYVVGAVRQVERAMEYLLSHLGSSLAA